jgi:hypothetical protein
MNNKKLNPQERDGEQETLSFLNTLRELTLTKTEAQDMRERLISYSQLHDSIQEPVAVSIFSYFQYSRVAFSRPLIAGGLIAVLLVGSTGVSYAAENALPGEPLYAVKVSVVEPIQTALITEPVAKAQWQSELASRRLTEASALAVQNKLATSTQEYLAQSVEQHVALAQEGASELSSSGNDPAALTVQSDLEAKLTAHADLLSALTPRLKASGTATTSVVAVTALLHVVDTNRNNLETSRKATEIALGASAVASSRSDSASTTPAEASVIALVDSQDTARHTEETNLFRKGSALFKYLPNPALEPATTSTSTNITATSTERISDGSDKLTAASSSEASSTSKMFPFYRLRNHN